MLVYQGVPSLSFFIFSHHVPRLYQFLDTHRAWSPSSARDGFPTNCRCRSDQNHGGKSREKMQRLSQTIAKLLANFPMKLLNHGCHSTTHRCPRGDPWVMRSLWVEKLRRGTSNATSAIPRMDVGRKRDLIQRIAMVHSRWSYKYLPTIPSPSFWLKHRKAWLPCSYRSG